ncbi:MAG: LEA type 2 family protein [Halobacteriales archaeon]|nr:LEA type 2 family protein [Halobacteriales archaeon]
MVNRRKALLVGGVVLLVAAAGIGVYVFQFAQNFESPTVESVDSSFGDVTNETTTIRNEITIQNPNSRSIPGAATLGFTVRMNDVTVAEGSQGGVGLPTGESTLTVDVPLQNDKIPEWWVTHINNGETTRLVTEPRVSLPAIPQSVELSATEQQLTTDLLSSVTTTESREVGVGNDTLLRVSNQRASWGEATAEETPLQIQTDIENLHDYPVQLDGTAYTIEMNGVTVGEGTTEDSFSLAPGEPGTFTANPVIDTPKMAEWWTSHIRANQTTDLSVRVYGLVERDGDLERVPLTIFERNARFQTDLLGAGTTEVSTIPGASSDTSFDRPTLVGKTSEWGEVTDATTNIETELVVSNPNDGSVGDIVVLNVGEQTAINGVTAASGQATFDGLEPGNNTFALTSEFRHDSVPAWWARHLNRGEQSTVVTQVKTTADIGVTRLDAPAVRNERTVSTDLLSSFESSEPTTIEQQGRTVATIERTSAQWGPATESVAPIQAEADIRNERSRPLTITDVTYTVRLNDVVLADEKVVRDETGSPEEYVIGPAETTTIDPTMKLDNSKMAEWWPTHVQNGETSTLTTEMYVTVETAFGSKRVRLDSFSQNQTVTTDFFGEN